MSIVIAVRIAIIIAALAALRYFYQWVEPLEDDNLEWAILIAGGSLVTAFASMLLAGTAESSDGYEFGEVIGGIALFCFVAALLFCTWRVGWEIYNSGGNVGSMTWWLIALGAIPVFILLVGAFAHISESREGYGGGDIPPLVTLLIALLATAAMITLATQATYTLFVEFAYYNPFDQPYSYGQLWLFYCDEALKGALFDFADVFKIEIEDQLHFEARQHIPFGTFIVLYRMCASFIVVGALIAIWKNR